MRSPAAELDARLRAALVAAFGPEHDVDPVLRPSQFADYQANVALALAKRLGAKPRDIADRLVAALDVADVCGPPEVSGPGFVNLALLPAWLSAAADDLSADPRHGLPEQERQVVVIDYSAPNVAKEMHVGHLRTTVVGDALARTLEALGHDVVRQNHIGDWGTPFGMLIEHLLDVGANSAEAALLTDRPNAFYQAARSKFDADADGFADRARRRVVALQAGDPATLTEWTALLGRSTTYFNAIYDELGVTLTDADLAGESSYNSDLEAVCEELEAAGIAVVSDGALCVFLDGFTGRGGKPVPLIIRKSDGGYGYGTTDLATVRHRVRDLHADRALYVVGAPQSLHLQMVFATARLAGWLPGSVEVTHVQIGSVLGPDGKMLKTRSGDPMSLQWLLDQALERAATVVADVRPDLPADERAVVARQVGIGAVKYADLSIAHDSGYTFDLDRMVSLTGNTGPYLQYAGARIHSILRRAADASAPAGPVVVGEPAERELVLALLGLGEVVEQVGASYEPHRLCTYLFELAQRLTTFYDQCPVMNAPDEATRASRLRICELSAAALETGLALLGIAAPDRM